MDGRWHFMAVGINQTTLSFYTDAKLQKAERLTRPVTDCSGRVLIIGAKDVPSLGEITFFPRPVTRTEMEEISQQGFSFESLASGNLPFEKEKSPFAAAAAIAELLDEPIGTLLARHHRALKKLKEMLTRAGPDQDPRTLGVQK